MLATTMLATTMAVGPGSSLMSSSRSLASSASRIQCQPHPMSAGDGLDDAVRATGVLVVVPADPVVPVFGLIDRDPVPGFGLAVLKVGLSFLLGARVGEADVVGVVQVQPLAVPGRDDRLRGDISVV